MGWKYIVPDWKIGYDSNSEHVSLFGVPKDAELRAKWVSVIPMTKILITSAHNMGKTFLGLWYWAEKFCNILAKFLYLNGIFR